MNFRAARKGHKRAELDMTPCIDCVFQLVLFFMLSSTFVAQTSIQIQVPEAKGSVALEQKDVSVTLASGEGGPEGKGPIYIGETAIASMAELSRYLSEARANQPDVLVLIRADARVQTARLVEVLGIASSVGIQRYGIAAQPPAEEAE